jgi:hypothetical protein
MFIKIYKSIYWNALRRPWRRAIVKAGIKYCT